MPIEQPKGKWVEYNKCAGQVPDEIEEFLGIGVLEVDATTTLTPQLSDQHDSPFILWETGSKRARIIGQATNLDVVVRAQMKCKKELDGFRREVATKEESVGELTDALASLPDFEGLDARAAESEETLALVESTTRRLTQARELADTLDEVQARATAVNVTPLLENLDGVETSLALLEKGEELATQLPIVEKNLGDFKTSRADHEEALQPLTLQLEEACTEAGVCIVCGGLLDHEECAT